jgi:hypothetical protein
MLNPELESEKCEKCGCLVYFDKSPEYDVCGECERHLCHKCFGGENEDICNECFLTAIEQEIVYVYPKVEKCNGFFYVDYVKKVYNGLKAEHYAFGFLYQAEKKLIELQEKIQK